MICSNFEFVSARPLRQSTTIMMDRDLRCSWSFKLPQIISSTGWSRQIADSRCLCSFLDCIVLYLHKYQGSILNLIPLFELCGILTVHVTASTRCYCSSETKNFVMWVSNQEFDRITRLYGIRRWNNSISSYAFSSRDQLVSDPDFLAWKQIDRLIKGWIISILSEEILSQVIGLDSAADLWFESKRKFI